MAALGGHSYVPTLSQSGIHKGVALSGCLSTCMTECLSISIIATLTYSRITRLDVVCLGMQPYRTVVRCRCKARRPYLHGPVHARSSRAVPRARLSCSCRPSCKLEASQEACKMYHRLGSIKLACSTPLAVLRHESVLLVRLYDTSGVSPIIACVYADPCLTPDKNVRAVAVGRDHP